MSLFLHQTTTFELCGKGKQLLYMSLFLHQTTTIGTPYQSIQSCICLYSYIKPQLFQTQTQKAISCICLYSYIKPQLGLVFTDFLLVVYVSIPTSNHNTFATDMEEQWLYMSLFLHQTTTGVNIRFVALVLYMSLFLHQTTTLVSATTRFTSCICLYSYIKPQPHEITSRAK